MTPSDPTRKPSKVRRLFHGTPAILGTIASVIAIAGVTVGAVKTLQPENGQPPLPEGRQIVSFHQLANRICSENTQALNGAFPAANSRIELLAFLSKATAWGVEDLSGVTPPPSLATTYAEEIGNRRKIAADLLDLQQAVETGDGPGSARVKVKLATAEAAATGLNRSLGLARCAPILPLRARNIES